MNIDHVTPQNDAVFKMIFTDPKHERVLIHFLNCAIESKDPIKKIKILNSELTKKHVSQKGSRLDIRAETSNGDVIDVEMQIGEDVHMIGRTLFYWSQMFSGELVVGEQYGKLRRTISIAILNFKLFHQDDRYWRKCHLRDDLTNEKVTDLLEIQFVELNKMRRFDKESPITFWIEFFKDPYSEICAELYKIVPELKEAKEIFEAAKADPKKRKLIEDREDALRNYASDIASAEERGEKIGAEKERAKAEEEKAELKAKAEAERVSMVKGLLRAGVDLKIISDTSGLTVQEIEKLKS